MHYKRQLHNPKKGWHVHKRLSNKGQDTLWSTGYSSHKVSDTEKVYSILSRLDNKYEAVVVVISSKETPPLIQYVHSILLAHEGRIEKRNQRYKDFLQTMYQRIKKGITVTKIGWLRGRGERWYNNNNRPRCKFCEKYGHGANKCYFRFDANYTPSNRGAAIKEAVQVQMWSVFNKILKFKRKM